MKKAILAVAMITAGMFANAQSIQVVKNVNVWESSYSPNDLYIKDCSSETKSFKYLMVFQNLEYKTIVDFGGFSFTTSDELKKFAEVLMQMITHSEKELKVEAKNYTLTRHDFAPYYIYVYDSKGKWTKLLKDEIEALNTQVANL